MTRSQILFTTVLAAVAMFIGVVLVFGLSSKQPVSAEVALFRNDKLLPDLTAAEWQQIETQLPRGMQEMRLAASDTQTEDWFGISVAASDDTVVVGTPHEDGGPGDPLHNAGAAYVFVRDQGRAGIWDQVAKLTADDAQAGDEFGWSVAISGDTIVVGARLEGGWAGAAYIFGRNQGGTETWGQVVKLTADDVQNFDFFGSSVAISGDTIIVGAVGEEGGPGDPLPDAGAAYVFGRNQGGVGVWGQVTKLTASDAQAGDVFGGSVAISGDTVIVGAVGEDGGPGDPQDTAGAAYVFDRNQGGPEVWGQVAKLTASDAQAGDRFSTAVAISVDTVVVSAWFEGGGPGDPLPDAGAAYIFGRNQGGAGAWGQAAKLTADDAQTGDEFGFSVAINGDTVVVGAFVEDGGPGDPLPDAGAAYIFSRNQGGTGAWGQTAKVAADDIQSNDFFGNSVAISGDTVIVGAPGEDSGSGDPLPDAGTAYVFVNLTLTIAKDGPALAATGELITYSLNVGNGLPVTLTGLVITDAIPSGATYVTGGTLVGDVVNWTVSSLESGQSITRQFVVTATTTITNSDYRVTASEGYATTGLLPVVTVMITDRSYMPAMWKP